MSRLRVRIVAVAVVLLLSASMAPAHASAFGERAQRALNRLGCHAGPVDGVVGAMTRAGVTRFQSANALAQSGRLTKQTRRRLYAERQVACNRRPVPAATGKGRRVVLSQKQNYLWLVRRGGRVVAQGPLVDNPAVVSTGTTRVGAQCGRAGKIRMNSDSGGSLWLPYFTRFYPCGVGFHRIPVYKSTGGQIHPDWMLGTDLRTSHGCVRLSRSLARAVWRFAGPGTRVVVR